MVCWLVWFQVVTSSCIDQNFWALCRELVVLLAPPGLFYLNSLVWRKKYRKITYFMRKTMVSCRFSLKSTHWLSRSTCWRYPWNHEHAGVAALLLGCCASSSWACRKGQGAPSIISIELGEGLVKISLALKRLNIANIYPSCKIFPNIHPSTLWWSQRSW